MEPPLIIPEVPSTIPIRAERVAAEQDLGKMVPMQRLLLAVMVAMVMSQVFLEPARIMVVVVVVGPNIRTILPCEASAGQAEAGTARPTVRDILGMPRLLLVLQTQAEEEAALAGCTESVVVNIGQVVRVLSLFATKQTALTEYLLLQLVEQ